MSPRYSIGRPLDGHDVRVGRFVRGRSPIGRGATLYGTTFRCSCGEEGRSNYPPSGGGQTDAQEWYRKHVAKVLALAAFPSYFDCADEIYPISPGHDAGGADWDPLTLDDLDARFVAEAKSFADEVGAPWPPELAWAEEHAHDLAEAERRAARTAS